MIHTHPSCGGGSCAACRAALDLDAIKREGIWYCSPTCAQGLPTSEKRTVGISEARLYHRPRRFRVMLVVVQG